MPDYGPLVERLNGRYICRKPECIQCLKSPETATVHWDCFRILDTYHMPRETVWTALAWRLPWRAAPTLFLGQNSLPSSVFTIADRLGIPLKRLPTELIYLIRNHSQHAKFWRYCSAADLGLELSRVVHAMVKSVPLATLSGWERGSVLATANRTSSLPVRLTIDARGIRRVERISDDLASKTGYQAGPSNGMVYIILKPKDIHNTTMHFQV